MKCSVHIDPTCEESVQVFARRECRLTEEIKRLCEEDAWELTGYRENEMCRLSLHEVCCFITESEKVYAVTERGRWRLKCRLYMLEDSLPDGFCRLNQSCIANLSQIDRFDTSFSGALQVKFKNGYTDFVSRRNLKIVKERFGITK